ncbi:Uncharacterised protein [Mycobacteroides abscessus]|nr:Uncharacterised protein [Mycobacteroides abscessus]CPX99402.1 Uncharacterised protein [Mycobacteroides abscessus]CQA11296.1 Uncharacterised protein [Mycobacteroides abscessus]
MGQAADRVESLHQDLEGHVLVLVGGQTALTDLSKQLCNRGVTGQINAQHQVVDEESDELIQRGVPAPGDREPHGHIGCTADTGQQHRKSRLHHHETGRTVLAGRRPHLLLQLGRPLHFNGGATLIGNRRIRPVRGQCHSLGKPGECAFPIGQLCRDRAVTVAEVAELRPLPKGVIDILHRQGRPVGSMAAAPAGVRDAQIMHQGGQGPSVGSNMMYHRNQHVFFLGDAENPCIQGYFDSQIEAATDYRGNGLVQLAALPARGVDDFPPEIDRAVRQHDLARVPAGCIETRTQAFVATDQVRQRSAQGGGVESAIEPQTHWHVVNR